MLVLSRKIGERIHIGDEIVLEIRRISGNRVTLAVAAPRSVRILRGELEKAAREFSAPLEMPGDASPSVKVVASLGILEPIATHPAAT